MTARYPFLDAPPLAFAHRGGTASEHPENTMAAFEAAVGLGYRYLETDAHATRDGVLVVFHDRTLRRVAGERGSIERMTWAELSAVRLGGGHRVPLLAELLDTWPDVRVNIDVKHPSAIRPLVDVLRRTRAVDRVCVGAFSDDRVHRVRRALGPQLATSLGPREVARLRAGAYAPGVAGHQHRRAACAQVPVRFGPLPVIDARLVRHAHALGLQVHAWTINDPAEMARLLDLGVDGIITDEIVTLKELLRRRRQWPE